MSEAVKEKSRAIIASSNDEENISRAEWEELMSRLQLDGFIGVKNIFKCPPVIEISNESALDNSDKAAPKNVNIAQHDTNRGSSENVEDSRLEYDIDMDYSISSSDWEKGLLVDQKYWEQYTSVLKNESNCKPKNPASQRLTVKDYDKIDHDKSCNRDPSHYKLDYFSTAVLKTISERKLVGAYHNVLRRSSHAVIIHADYPYVPWTRGVSRVRVSPHYGVAVKVYKLSSDVERNNAILKRVHREYTSLLHLKRHAWYVPRILHKMKNVIVTEFIGNDQESPPSLSIVPPEYCTKMYQRITGEMVKWYKKLNLIHGNLSTNNIMVVCYNDSYYGLTHIPYITGWSRSVSTNHPNALVKLFRDCQYVTNVS